VSKAFPAWCLGKNPDEKIICASHTATLAERMSRSVQNLMSQDVYLDTFDTRIKSTQDGSNPKRKKLKETDRLFEMVEGEGYYLATGVGGAVTGDGGTILIVDDAVKDALQAESKTWRDRTWQWYTETLLSRGEGDLTTDGDEGDERVVVCATAWHDDDPTGRILKLAKATGEKWVVIRFPAVYEPPDASSKSLYKASPEWCVDPRQPGEALWPARRNLAKLKEIEARSSRHWNSNWQQRPSPEQGGMFKRAYWQWYRHPDELPKFDRIVFSLDAAFKENPTSSRVALGKWGIAGKQRYLLDLWCGHMGIVKTEALLTREFSAENSPCTKLIEDKANGTALIERLKDKYHGITPIEPKGGKQARSVAVLPIIEGGDVFLPDYLPAAHALVDEAAAFPYGEFDDMVDMTTQLLQYLHYDAGSWLRAVNSGFREMG